MYFFLIYMEIQSKEMVFFFSLMFYLQNKTKQKKICQVWLKLPVLLNLLVACTRLCKLLCQSVRRSIGRSLFTKYVTYGDWPCLYNAIFHIFFLFLVSYLPCSLIKKYNLLCAQIVFFFLLTFTLIYIFFAIVSQLTLDVDCYFIIFFLYESLALIMAIIIMFLSWTNINHSFLFKSKNFLVSGKYPSFSTTLA